MGSHTKAPVVMDWQSTLALMKVHGTTVIRSCGPCGLWGELDLDHAAQELRGSDMTLWDCQPPCPFCSGPMMHHCGLGGTPRRPMLSTPPDSPLKPLPPQAWMAGWRGRLDWS